MRDELIRDQLIEKTSNPRVQEELLLKDATLSLEDALTFALQVEAATQCAAKIAENKSHTAVIEQPVQQLSSSDNLADPAAIQVARPQQTRQQRRCGNCGSTRHDTRAQDCPARGQTCRRCQKPNHFARWCRSAPADYSEQSHDPVVPVRTIGPHPGTFSRCPVYLDGRCVPLLLDTGAKVSLLNVDTCNLLFPNRQMQLLSVATAAAKSTLLAYFISQFVTPLQPWTASHFTLHAMVRTSWALTSFSALALPYRTTTEHAYYNVPPVVQPLRRVPLALRDGVTQELQRLQADGIIEPIDASPWVSNLVIARKKSGGRRVCFDLRQVNKALVPDKYPLPTTEELTTHFYGSRVF
ncbi:hypothetical protein DPEC_G00221370 [Dallia pectoralis]|uniref:Uncharacterized protein n=1 Tax=Dallia pectoralis TaxID=75939 RepID=A0ACC2G449_DALPE|nr:hypothetical protein DPEC_G00221370 [Dallia pectoralis]